MKTPETWVDADGKPVYVKGSRKNATERLTLAEFVSVVDMISGTVTRADGVVFRAPFRQLEFVLNRTVSRLNFGGTDRFFAACWSQYLRYLETAIDFPKTQEEVSAWLDSIASEKVNDPKSKFFIHG